jgi:hypothetical protein
MPIPVIIAIKLLCLTVLGVIGGWQVAVIMGCLDGAAIAIGVHLKSS